ncbi:MAG: SRPBCC domain-containing protein [Proteobacteria bacterium]|nr:SRPBCC domain-containing protein [Pseudomonadota bacterium]
MNSFRIEQAIEINAKPEKVFAQLTNDVSSWWDHSFLDNPKAVVLEPKIGGRFYEDHGNGNGALYCTVIFVETNKNLVMQGAMGMRGAVFGNISFELEEQGVATLLKLSHCAFGDVNEDHKASYSKGWQDLLGRRLKDLVEQGTIK